MQRLFDWKCDTCGERAEELVDVPHGEKPPKQAPFVCGTCVAETVHTRQLSMPAPYMGERNLSPRVYGGQFDTMGAQQGPDAPALPGEAEHMDHVADKLAALGEDAPHEERAAVMRETLQQAPNSDDYAAHFATPEYQETMAQRRQIQASNKQKRARAAAMLRGENVNFRRDKAAGDPNMAA